MALGNQSCRHIELAGIWNQFHDGKWGMVAPKIPNQFKLFQSSGIQ